MTTAQTAQQSVSGVNLDQEAANLLQFQQAYQAAAQVIAGSQTLFQSLITAINTVA
jgi:flagellar hook-associated protein 1 FlgK